jgi:hypothetical protein
VAEIQQKGVNNSIVIDKTIKVKQTERKSGFNWWWLLLLIPIYFVYRKFFA